MGFFDLFRKESSYRAVQSSNDDDSQVEYTEYTELPVAISPKEERSLQLMRQGSEMANGLAKAWVESKRIEANIKALRIQTNADLQKHAQRIQLCERYIMATFGERSRALSKHYQVLDMALENGDREMILHSLQGISAIVVKDPLENLEKLAMVLTDKSQPLQLDF